MLELPSTTWRTLAQRRPGKPLPTGLDAIWDSAGGWIHRMTHRRQRYLARAEKVLALEPHFITVSDASLRQTIDDLRQRFRRGRDDASDILRGFAAIREACHRRVGLKPFAVQVAGALALEDDCVVEMATGEGKTLTAVMPAVVAGWRGQGCHIITANDYLAQRDAEEMKPIYHFCGVAVAHIQQETEPAARQAAYQADVTYTTNKEVTADFLRDRLALGRPLGLPEAILAKIVDGVGSGADRLVQRGLARAIVDEADSILVDEAVTPLIISGEAPNPQQVEAFEQAAELVSDLQENTHYTVNQRYREVELTNTGKRRLGELAEGRGGLWTGARRREELATQALTARTLFQRDKQYVIQEEKVVIVDEFTGRLMPDREWRDGLHQAVTAKEQLEVVPQKDTYARISFQRFFRMYRHLAGMTGTATEAWKEFWQVYHLPIVVIPTNRPCVRRVEPPRVYANQEAKWEALVSEIRQLHDTQRPVLVGTRSVRTSEHLSGMLTAIGLDHQVLNAVRHREEAQIVASAGQPGRITVATNMAGRGTDIKLGRGVADLGGLHVIATERHEAGRIDRQLFGRCARQGDPGTSRAFEALDDELLKRHAPTVSSALRRRYGSVDREISSSLTRALFDRTQRRAESMALRQRKAVLKTDDWLDQYLGFAGAEI